MTTSDVVTYTTPAGSVFPTDPVWAIDEHQLPAIRRAVAKVDATGLRSFFKDTAAADRLPLVQAGKVAVIPITGPITRRRSIFSMFFAASDTQSLHAAFVKALIDEGTESILLQVDSPGGTVSGIADLADVIFAARGTKPIVAQVSGMCASAAYFLTSQADKVYAGRADDVGNIGVISTMLDASEAFSKEGLELVQTKTGPIKGLGEIGSKITDEQRRDTQRMVDAAMDDFVAAVARGRGLNESQVRAAGDGRLFGANQAKDLGLIDGIQRIETTLAQLGASLTDEQAATLAALGSNHKETKAMAQPDNQTTTPAQPAQPAAATVPAAPAAASYDQIVAACPGADPDFICGQLKIGATADQVKGNWLSYQQQQLDDRIAAVEAREEKLAEQSKAESVKANMPGGDGVGTEQNASASADAGAGLSAELRFKKAIKQRTDAGMDRRAALVDLKAQDPELYGEYLDEHNQKHQPVDVQLRQSAGGRAS